MQIVIFTLQSEGIEPEEGIGCSAKTLLPLCSVKTLLPLFIEYGANDVLDFIQHNSPL